MNKLIDLGAHTFEGINHLRNRGIIDSSYGIYSFEPNPNVYNKALQKLEENAKNFQYLNLYDYAVGNKDKEVVFHLDESKTSEACNILNQPPNLKELWQRPNWVWTQINVKCISAKTLFELCDIQPNDYVKIKCDIEGAEFEFLKDLLDNKDLSMVKQLIVEWHDGFWYENREPKIKEKHELTNAFLSKNISILEWH